jgi:hypothetical protein
MNLISDDSAENFSDFNQLSFNLGEFQILEKHTVWGCILISNCVFDWFSFAYLSILSGLVV